MPIPTHEERIGTVLGGKYRIDQILGLGGMGAVFAGVHQLTGRSVAVKLLHHEHVRNPESGQRFLREARTAAEIRHPNVVDILDMGVEPDGTVFMVLELLQGMTLAQVLEQTHQLGHAQAADILIPVMRALVYAHRKNIIHRDLKPDNIFVHEDSTGGVVPKLLDFGIAKAIDHSSARVTQTGFILGTPSYMSPEQVAGLHDKVGPQSDVWAMGVVWYETLTGEAPFDGPTPTATLMNINSGRVIHIEDKLPDLPRALCDAIDRALVRDASRRHPTMMAFLEAISRALGRPITIAGSTLSDFTNPGLNVASLAPERSSLVSISQPGTFSILDIDEEAPIPFPLSKPAQGRTSSQPPSLMASDPGARATSSIPPSSDPAPRSPSLDSKPWVLGNAAADRAPSPSMRPPLGPSDRPPFRLTGVDNTPPAEVLPLTPPKPRSAGMRAAAVVAAFVGVAGASWVALSGFPWEPRSRTNDPIRQQIAHFATDASLPPMAMTRPDAPNDTTPVTPVTQGATDASATEQSDATANAPSPPPTPATAPPDEASERGHRRHRRHR